MYLFNQQLKIWVSDDGFFLNEKGEKPQHTTENGYKTISIKKKTYYSHRVVYETFIKVIDEEMQINHINGLKSDNRLSNLEEVTPSWNLRHAHRTGLKPNNDGETNNMSKLTNDEYLQIISLILEGYSNTYIAQKYNLHSRYVSLIRGRKRLKTIWELWETNNYPVKYVPDSNDKSKVSYPDRLKLISELDKYTNKELADIYQIAPSTISRVRSKQTWLNLWDVHLEKDQRLAEKRTSQANGDGNGGLPNLEGDIV
jgi:DNA-binding CsgD family transcriptional regulator